jgi:hypothetical protein
MGLPTAGNPSSITKKTSPLKDEVVEFATLNRPLACCLETTGLTVGPHRYGSRPSGIDTVPLVTAGHPASPTALPSAGPLPDSESGSAKQLRRPFNLRRTPVRSDHRLSAALDAQAYFPFFFVVEIYKPL